MPQLVELSIELTDKLEASELAKQASEERVVVLEKEIERLSRENESLKRMTKSASGKTFHPSLLATLNRLESAGFVKAGAAIELYQTIQEDPNFVISVLSNVADAFGGPSEGSLIDKQASFVENQEDLGNGVYVDQDGWHRLLKTKN